MQNFRSECFLHGPLTETLLVNLYQLIRPQLCATRAWQGAVWRWKTTPSGGNFVKERYKKFLKDFKLASRVPALKFLTATTEILFLSNAALGSVRLHPSLHFWNMSSGRGSISGLDFHLDNRETCKRTNVTQYWNTWNVPLDMFPTNDRPNKNAANSHKYKNIWGLSRCQHTRTINFRLGFLQLSMTEFLLSPCLQQL